MKPFLFAIGDFQVRVYSLMYLAGILITLYFVGKKGKSIGIPKDKMENAIIAAFFGGIVGARLYYVMFNASNYKWYEIFAVWQGGLAIHGGVIGATVAAFIYSRYTKIHVYTMADAAAPFILFSQGIGRIGNFANGEAHGVPVITPPSVIFGWQNNFSEFWKTALNTLKIPNNRTELYKAADIVNEQGAVPINFEGKVYILKQYVPWGISFSEKYLPPAYRDFGTLHVHPTFFYEMILNFIAATILLTLWRKNENIGTGKIIGLYMIFYGVIRGFVTFFRADDLMLFGSLIRAPHLASIAMIVVGFLMIYPFRREDVSTDRMINQKKKKKGAKR